MSVANLHLMERFMTDISTMELEDLEFGKDEGTDKEPGVVLATGFRAYRV